MRSKIYVSILTVLVLVFCTVNQSLAQTPISSKAVRFAESIPVRDMPVLQLDKKEGKGKNIEGMDHEINEKNEIPLKNFDPNAPASPDAALSSSRPVNINSPLSHAPNPPSVSFEGISLVNTQAIGQGFTPPDITGEAGLNHFVQAVNVAFRIWNKTGTPLTGTVAFSTLFAPLGSPAGTSDDGDPIVLYDQLADRWLISQFINTANPNNHQVIAISKTGDPTGAYYLYDFIMPNNKFNDYPKFGVWPDGYYMTDNQFNQAGTAFQGAGVFAFNRTKMLVGDPTASFIYFDLCSSNSGCVDGGLLPSDLDGLTPPPTGAPNVFAEFTADEDGGGAIDGIKFWDFHTDFTVPSNSTFTSRTGSPLAVPAFDPRTVPTSGIAITQPGTAARLDAINDRLMFRLAYRNSGGTESLIANHTVNAATNPTYRAGVRFYQLNRTSPAAAFTVAEAQTFAGGSGDAENRWMGSGAMNFQGDIAVGYSVSSTTVNPSIRYAAKLGTDPAGSGLLQGEQTIISGTGSQTGGGNRWGDYSQMSVDPSDDCSFWYTQEYYQTTSSGNWQTRIVKFSPGTTAVSSRGTISGTITNCSTGLPIANAFIQITGGFSRATIANGTYAATIPPGNYTATVTAPNYNTATSGSLVVTNGGTTTFNACLVGMPVPVSDVTIITTESCLPANNGIDPNETVTVSFAIKNTGTSNSTNLVATLQATGGVLSPSGPQNYGVIIAGGPAVSKSFTFTAANLACGTPLVATLQLQDGALNLGTITYNFITGSTIPSAPVTFSYTGPAVAIPDNVAAGVNIPLTVSGAGTLVTDLNFRFDPLAGCDNVTGNVNAAMDHTFLGDLIFKLTSPGGTTVTFMNSRGGGGNNICNLFFDDDGGFPAISTLPTTGGVSGNFAPENPFSAFDGQNANGTWTLNVSDNGGLDVGSLRRFSLILTTATPICCTGGPAGLVLTCPANITRVSTAGLCTAPVTFAATATDNCAGGVTITSVPVSGSLFPIGTTAVTVTATDMCGNTSACSFNITVTDGQIPVINNQPVNRTVCAGTTATFSITATNAVSYQWQQFIAGAWTNIAGATNATLTLNAVTASMNTNTYRVNVIGFCTTVTSGFVSLYVNPLPTINLTASDPPVLLPTQTISITANVNPTGGTFIWFKNGVPLVPAVTTATLSNLRVENAGTYRAVYTDLNGCINTSEDIVVSAEASDRLYIAPNPNFGQFTVRYFNQINEQLVLRVFDSKGALAYQQSVTTTFVYTKIEVNLGINAQGVYLVELRRANGQFLGAKRIIVGHR